MADNLEKAIVSPQETEGLLRNLRELIQGARQKSSKSRRCSSGSDLLADRPVHRRFRAGGAARAEYGTRLLPVLAESLTREFGRGFDASNLRYMRLFYQAFPIRDALRHELSWTHYRSLLKLEQEGARSWYMAEAAAQGWTTRALERQINTLYYERLLATTDRPSVEREALVSTASLQTPRDFVRDPVMLEFLGLPGAGRLLEADLERALLDNSQAFLLELGRGFAFVGRQYRISSETKDFYVDLVFYNFLLKCFVLHESEQMFASRYKLVLPSEDELRTELERERDQFRERTSQAATASDL
jgi:predicted nuclease of restriction endonuclease-like (RecB) superfamily